ncbi:ABC transporter ATP-binding protein [uncultured Jatrophihabitans sp.]|uniref:ABC transporter ATP-binding protein n=1 Tax=uncultured Jatrophihabitans sp. TaxID=1610747 RepID=UPI0035C9B357
MTVVDAALDVRDLSIRLHNGPRIVEELDLRLAPGEILGLVGESGSGKTTTARAMLGFCGRGVEVESGTLTLAGTKMPMDESMRTSRGSVIGYVPQNPGRSLNPSMRVGAIIRDLLHEHRPQEDSTATVLQLLEMVGLPASEEFTKRFPHQLSGGQQQRVCIAAALSCHPSIIVLDEPTTGLDVVTQQKILERLQVLRDEHQIAMVYVTHDLAVVAQVADRIAVMYAGRIVEEGPALRVLTRPRHPYTRGLLASIPDHVKPHALDPMPGISVGVGERPEGCCFAPRCPQRVHECTEMLPPLLGISDSHAVRCIRSELTPPVELTASAERVRGEESAVAPLLQVEHLKIVFHSRHGSVVAVEDLTFSIDRGNCLAIVGESGSGKTTTARAIAGLQSFTGGRILLDGQELSPLTKSRSNEQRQQIQLVFQNPVDALNPRHTVEQIVSRPARQLRRLDARAADREVSALLDKVRLPRRVARRYPGELSGGECQRVSIARALAAGPQLILCDEVTSALDVSVQAAVLDLLNELRLDLGVSLMFITHDLGVVSAVADHVIVLQNGHMREQGEAREVLRNPQDEYTNQLLEAAPSVSVVVDGWSSTVDGPLDLVDPNPVRPTIR